MTRHQRNPRKVRMSGPEGERSPSLQVEVTPDEPVVLTIEPVHEGELEVVDRQHGEPLDVSVASTRATIVRLDTGHFALASRYPTLAVTLSGDGVAPRVVQVPLDEDSVFEVALAPDRQVDVHLICTDCPTSLVCGWFGHPCTGSGTDWTCDCPPEALALIADDGIGREVATIPRGVSSLTVDLREAEVHGRWTGPLPCTVPIQGETPRRGVSGACAADGSFSLKVPAGIWSISASRGDDRAVGATEWFAVLAGDSVDVGVLSPGEQTMLLVAPAHGGPFETTLWTDESLIWTLNAPRTAARESSPHDTADTGP